MRRPKFAAIASENQAMACVAADQCKLPPCRRLRQRQIIAQAVPAVPKKTSHNEFGCMDEMLRKNLRAPSKLPETYCSANRDCSPSRSCQRYWLAFTNRSCQA